MPQLPDIDATDIILPVDSLGLGQPWSPSNPAIAADWGYSSDGTTSPAPKATAGLDAPAGQGATSSPLPAVAGPNQTRPGSAPVSVTVTKAVAAPSSSWFVRGVVVIIGFILVGAGAWALTKQQTIEVAPHA